MRPLPLPPARTPGNGALQRQALQAGRRCAAILLETTGRRSPRDLVPEDSARQRASGGLFLDLECGQKTAAQWQYAAG